MYPALVTWYESNKHKVEVVYVSSDFDFAAHEKLVSDFGFCCLPFQHNVATMLKLQYGIWGGKETELMCAWRNIMKRPELPRRGGLPSAVLVEDQGDLGRELLFVTEDQFDSEHPELYTRRWETILKSLDLSKPF
ncbi:MAG: hypothetical protein KVP17_001941 [Porospora cf. gigantea B]|uniref:uncharacterized protein n=1 Tax=Porospora cf. gigantea B TaxID=2853592 RepID=UPI003571A020|nr:MAG: hypothetical protein KVP17_001941 [Porospora cf. gigantea B]